MGDVMPQVETVVMLMLENRSLNSVLGWLHHDETLGEEQVYPPGSSNTFNGIRPDDHNDYFGVPYQPGHGTQQMADPMRVPRWNSHEIFEHVTVQMYSDGDGVIPDDPWPQEPPMTGFVYDYHDRNAGEPSALNEVMGGYDKQQLPVLYGLAENFAVSDRWFCSVPTETNANRAFSICGTSLGAVDNADIPLFDAKTIFNALHDHKTWGVYWQYRGIGSGDPKHLFPRAYTEDLFPQIAEVATKGSVSKYRDLLKALRAGDDIPEFCYVEPFWSGGVGCPDGDDFLGLTGNDYHAPAWIGQGEFDLNELYTALRASKQWDKMLFIITFDEHGGTWDHEPPTCALSPDPHQKINGQTPRFDFTRFGPRVPTILASPYIRPGTVFRAPADSSYDFDHTSFIATLLRWAGRDPAEEGMGDRVAAAPTFEGVLSDEPCNEAPETFDVPPPDAELGGRKGIHLPGFVCTLQVAWSEVKATLRSRFGR